MNQKSAASQAQLSVEQGLFILDEKELTTKTHETSRTKITNFVAFLRVASCVFVVSAFTAENGIDPGVEPIINAPSTLKFTLRQTPPAAA